MAAVTAIAAVPTGSAVTGTVFAKTAAAAGAAGSTLSAGSAIAAIAAVSSLDSTVTDIDKCALIQPDAKRAAAALTADAVRTTCGSTAATATGTAIAVTVICPVNTSCAAATATAAATGLTGYAAGAA
jgi:hypothetical protein